MWSQFILKLFFSRLPSLSSLSCHLDHPEFFSQNILLLLKAWTDESLWLKKIHVFTGDEWKLMWSYQLSRITGNILVRGKGSKRYWRFFGLKNRNVIHKSAIHHLQFPVSRLIAAFTGSLMMRTRHSAVCGTLAPSFSRCHQKPHL